MGSVETLKRPEQESLFRLSWADKNHAVHVVEFVRTVDYFEDVKADPRTTRLPEMEKVLANVRVVTGHNRLEEFQDVAFSSKTIPAIFRGASSGDMFMYRVVQNPTAQDETLPVARELGQADFKRMSLRLMG